MTEKMKDNLIWVVTYQDDERGEMGFGAYSTEKQAVQAMETHVRKRFSKKQRDRFGEKGAYQPTTLAVGVKLDDKVDWYRWVKPFKSMRGKRS